MPVDIFDLRNETSSTRTTVGLGRRSSAKG